MNLKNEILYLRKFYRRNSKVLNCISRNIEKNKVNIHWWSTQMPNGLENIGDYLSIVVCEYLLNKKGLSLDTKIEGNKHLYTIGSIIQGGAQNATIWGSGIKNGVNDLSILSRKIRKLDIRLVRGPETRKVLIESGYTCPELYGDPAILMPLIYKPKITEKKEYIVVLHHATTRKIENSITPLSNDYKGFIDNLANSKLVISSSLHGIILAETYGVPAILLTDKVTDNLFKYNDYYFSTTRTKYPIVNSIEQALNTKPAALPDFTEIRKNIIDTFPYDLWETGRKRYD